MLYWKSLHTRQFNSTMKKDTYRLIEITAVFLTVVGKLIYDNYQDQKSIIAAVIIAFWVGYIVIRRITKKGLFKHWGFTKTNFRPAIICVGIVGAILICGIITYGLVRHNAKFNVNILKAIPLYIIWGLVQQFIFISLFAGNLKDLEKIEIDKFLIVAITSILFSALHTSNDALVIVTSFMAIFCTFIFLKYRNLFPLGIFHGVVGAVFYYFALNEDPWAELITSIWSKICT